MNADMFELMVDFSSEEWIFDEVLTKASDDEMPQVVLTKSTDDVEPGEIVEIASCSGYHFDMVTMKRKRGCVECQSKKKCRRARVRVLEGI